MPGLPQHTHCHASHFRYEKVPAPFFGPPRLATEALRKANDVAPQTEEAFLDYLLARYPTVYDQLEWVKFHTFDWHGQKEPFTYRLAIVNLAPDPLIRRLLFDNREAITMATGWYPLVQGSRAEVQSPPYQAIQRRMRVSDSVGAFRPIGLLKRITPIASSGEGGNSFKLQGTTGALLLDFGFEGQQLSDGDFSVRILTHFHRDHSGGVWEALRGSRSPFVLSRASLAYFWLLRNVTEADKLVLAQSAIYPEDLRETEMSDGANIDFFPVFHCPGSYGVRIVDRNKTNVIYFGDLCLRNGFRDYREEAYRIATQGPASNRWALVDAAMVGKKDAIAEEDTPAAILGELTQNSRRRNVVFVSTQPETLLYSYVQTFALTRNVDGPPIRILLSPELLLVLHALWKPVILRRPNDIDPVVQSVVGKSLSNFVESHRLYPLHESVLSKLPTGEACVLFCSLSDIANTESLRKIIKKSDVIFSGTCALRADVPPEILEARPRSILRVESPDWSFHSSEDDLVPFINRLVAAQTKVLLFHNHPKTLRKFVRTYGFDPDLVRVMSSAPVELG